MQKSTKAKVGGGLTAIVLALGMGVVASGATSAYFSDTNSGGVITASYGSIYVDVDGNKTTTPNLDLRDLLPGETKTGEFTVANSGRSDQDVHVQFDSDAVLKLVNQLGRSAAIEIAVDGERVFFSDNLNDGYPGNPAVTPLPKTLTLVEGLAPGASAQVTFAFTYAASNTAQLPIEIPLNLPYSVIATQPGIAPGA
jgi:hypothetical protein